MKAKRNYRESLFRSVFNNKKNLLSLYNALEGTGYTAPENHKSCRSGKRMSHLFEGMVLAMYGRGMS